MISLWGPDSIDTTQRSIQRHVKLLILLAFALIALLVVCGAYASFAGAVIASGRVAVQGSTKKIQHPTGGTIEEINVKEGDSVKEGQILIRLSGTVVKANLTIIENTLAQLYVRRARLRAESSGNSTFELPAGDVEGFASATAAHSLFVSEQALFKSRTNALTGMKAQMSAQESQLKEERDGNTAQIQSIDEELAVVQGETSKIEELYKRGLTTLQRLNLLKRQSIELRGEKGQQIAARAQGDAKLSELALQALQLDANRQSEVSKDLADTEASIAEYEERRAAGKDQLDRLAIRSPIAGRVYQLTVHSSNAVVQPGDVLMMVVPEDNALYVEAHIQPQDIDQAYVGQPVDVRFTAFDLANTPDLHGTVSVIAPDLISDNNNGAPYYALQISLNNARDINGFSLYPGMPAEVFLRTKDRNVLSYLIKPIQDRLKHTFRE